MKHLIYTLLSVLVLMACDDWFDAAPQDGNIDEKTLFGNEQAFRNALNGIYTEMRADDLYGSALFLGGVEFLGQNFVPDASLKELANFNYTAEEPQQLAANAWTAMYRAIYSCNNLMRLLREKKEVVFVKGSREMMLAELKALRAAMHYELVRLFHPAYVADPDFKGVAWMEAEKAEPQVWTTEKLVGHILEELQEAAGELEKYDPIVTGESYNAEALFGTKPADRFWKMNYYAALGVEARIWMTIGTPGAYGKALACARKIISSGEYALVEIPGTDLAFSSEALFALSSPEEGLQRLAEELFTRRNIRMSAAAGINELQARAPDDKRLKWFTTDLSSMQPKYGKGSKVASWGTPPCIPFIKYGEICLIAAEAALHAEQDKSVGYALLKEFLDGRYSGMTLTEDADKEEMLEEIERQYRYEFIGEGQLFWYYKRLNKSSIPGWQGNVIRMNPEQYCFPLPAV